MFALFLALSTMAFAQAQQDEPVIPRQERSDLVHDLSSRNAADRRYAARDLRREAKSIHRRLDARSDIARLEARVAMADLRTDLGHAPRRCLEHADVRAACAEIIRLVGDSGAVDALRAARADEERERVLAQLDAALAALAAP